MAEGAGREELEGYERTFTNTGSVIHLRKPGEVAALCKKRPVFLVSEAYNPSYFDGFPICHWCLGAVQLAVAVHAS